MLIPFLWTVAIFNLALFAVYPAKDTLNATIKILLLLIGVFSILFATGVIK